MQRELGPDHRVIEEGLNGRTTVFDDPIEPAVAAPTICRRACAATPRSTLLIIALGCNDMKALFQSRQPTSRLGPNG